MAGECDWSGFVTQEHSGVREALFAAGVDCTAPESGESGAWEEPAELGGHRRWHGHDRE
jgi:hypothetical protein